MTKLSAIVCFQQVLLQQLVFDRDEFVDWFLEDDDQANEVVAAIGIGDEMLHGTHVGAMLPGPNGAKRFRLATKLGVISDRSRGRSTLISGM